MELEVDPLNVDHFSCTPLMWACALGHLEAAVVLYKWDRRAISIPDSLGRLPLGIARSRGHVKLAECLEHLQRDEQAQLGQASRIHCAPSEEPTTDSWMAQWQREAMSPPEIPKGVTVIASTNPVQVTGNPKGTSVVKDAAPSQVRPREPMSVLMLANREVVNTEMGAYRDRTEHEDCPQPMDDIQVNMMTLAEHIIEATPDRIKQENFVPMESSALERTDPATISSTMSWLASYLADADRLPSAAHIRSAYTEPLTPSSNASLSPAGSPVSEVAFEKPSLPSAADWSEFLSASTSEKVESELAQLTLSDHEQRELYEAARLVQTAFRKYKGRPLREQQEVAAAVIQRCYRKYKQLTWIALKYALYKKMTQAAILIQSKFRSYYEQKRFQQSRRAAVLIQNFYRSYKKCGRRRPARRTAVIVQQKLRSSLLTKKQDQAARKIMRFLRRCRHRVKELKKAKELEDIQQHPLAM